MSFSNIARGFNRGKVQREIYRKKVYIVSLQLKPQAILKLDLIIIFKKLKIHKALRTYLFYKLLSKSLRSLRKTLAVFAVKKILKS